MDAFIPPGTISAFGGTNVPGGWLLCDGSVLSSSQFPRLFGAISNWWGAGTSGGIAGTNDFNLPDLRGLFLRGLNGTQSDVFADPDIDTNSRANIFIGGNQGNAVGSYQMDQLASHTHEQKMGDADDLNCTHSYAKNALADGPNAYHSGSYTWPFGGNETRSKNAYVNYIIKY